MSKKDYEAIAGMLRAQYAQCQSSRERAMVTGIASRLSFYFEADNPRFNRHLWVRKACPIPKGWDVAETGTEGQDRESYSDDQDRESYSTT